MVQLFQRPIIKVIRQTQNYGEAKSRANALIYTNNDFVLFLDSFVECLPGYLIQMVNLLQGGLYISRNFNKIDESGLNRIIRIKLFHRWREGNSPGIEEYCLTLEKKRIRVKKCDFPAKRTSDSQQWNVLQKVGIVSFSI